MSLPPSPNPVSVPEDEDFISLAPLWGLVRRYRLWLELSLFALVLLAAGLFSASYVILPKKVQSELEFTLNFPQAALGFYPNQLPFRPEDLLESSVLRTIYEQNNLHIYLKFDEFKSGFSLERAGLELDLLQRDFRSRLDDRKLVLADREKIEAQFEAQFKSLPATTYQLNFRQTARSSRLIPFAQQSKVLEEVLRRWSDDAVTQKKVLAFAARLPSQMELAPKANDPLVSLTELLERTRVLANGLGELARLPGGHQAMVSSGAKLADLYLRLDFLQEIRIPQIRAALLGSIADPGHAAMIERVLRLQVRIREDRLRLADEKLCAALSTYREYLTSTAPSAATTGQPSPKEGEVGSGGGTQLQFSDTFLTKLMEMGVGKQDVQYRTSMVEKIRNARLQVAAEEAALRETQEILEALNKKVSLSEKTAATAKIPPGPASENDFVSSLILGCQELNDLIADSEKLRAKVTENYMSPQTSLYRITMPVISQSTSLLTLRNAGLFLAAFVVVGLGIVFAACWAHERSTKPQE